MVRYNVLFAALKKEGWYIVRQKGSHVILRHPSRKEQLTIPYHPGIEVKMGLLKAILKKANTKLEQR